jgi:hypothetical protein
MTFVSLPRAVVDLGVVKVGLKVELAELQSADPLKADIMLVQVESPPACAWQWSGEAAPAAPLRVLSVFGSSNSSIVCGEGVLSLSSDGESYRFVQAQGEPGNSGTLMFGTRDGDTLMCLGTYYGIERASGGLRHRGVVSRLPQLSDFHFVDVVQNFPTNSFDFDVTTANSVRKVTYHVESSAVVDDGKKYPGIFIKGTTKYCGSMHIGSCRAK